MKKKRILFAAAALCSAAWAMAAVPSGIGAIQGKNVPLYDQHNADATNLSTVRDVTLDYKVVTIDGTSYVYMHCSNDAVPGADWGLQYRYWSESMVKTENNVTVKTATYATQTVTTPMPDPLKYITFFADAGGFSETDFITYDPTLFNGADASDKTAPAISDVVVTPSSTQVALTISSDDVDAFYYVEDGNGHHTVVLTAEGKLTGLEENTSYTITITPIDFNGNVGTAVQRTFSTGGAISSVTVPATTATFNMAEGWGVFEDVTDPEHGSVVHALAETGQAWAMVQANKPLPEGLGADGSEFSYAHVVCKPAKDGQVVRGSFTGMEVPMTNTYLKGGQWVDVVFAFDKAKVQDIVVFMDYYGEGKPADLPKELWLKEVVLNNDATPLIAVQADEEAPVLVSAQLVDGSLTYSSVQIAVEATDNELVAGFVVEDAARAFNGEFTANDGVILVKGLLPNTSYTFSVQAKDASGNLSTAVVLPEVTTPERPSEPEGDLYHFDGLNGGPVHYTITEVDGKIVYTLTVEAGNSLNFAEIRFFRNGEFTGFYGMTLAADGLSATYELTDVAAGEVLYNMFVWGGIGANPEVHYQNVADINSTDQYIYYVVEYDPTSIDGREQTGGLAAYAADGVLYLCSEKEQTVDLYGADGRRVASLTVPKGTTALPGLSKGVYLFRGGKVIVR